MDDKTTLIVYGDHGMTASGDHGGSTDMELKTVFFAYQKTPFPLGELYQKERESFETFDKNFKISDITSTMSLLLDIPFPFVNIGAFHPAVAPTKDLISVHHSYLRLLNQVSLYITTYCEASPALLWCEEEIESFTSAVYQHKQAYELNIRGRTPPIEILDDIS
jgi:phosphatidylinositol glycan class O